MARPPKPKAPKDHDSARGLSKEDQDLWQRVTDTITPMIKLNKAEDTTLFNTSPNRVAAEAPDKSHPAPRKQRQLPGTGHRFGKQQQQSPMSAPELSGLGQASVRRIRSGRISIDARLDLHGMRQAEAHAALRRFMFAAHQHGHRWVLVITGKGGQPASSQRDPDTSNMHAGPGSPGVLRRNVPLWLQEPEFRSIIIGYQAAGPQHGGDGALYINLRRRERAGKYRC